MTTPYLSKTSVNDFSLNFCLETYNAVLVQAANLVLTVPGSAPRYKAVIKVTGGPVFIRLNNAVVAPVVGSFVLQSYADCTSQYVDYCRDVKENDQLHFLTPTAGVSVFVSFYSLYTNN